jgi:hypothetical protein
LKIDPASVTLRPRLPSGSISPGIYPYLGGTPVLDQLKFIVGAYGGAVVSGLQGAKLAAQVPGVLLDPAQYGPKPDGSQPDTGLDALFAYDDWLERQQAVDAPVILTDTPRIPKGDRSALRNALGRWEMLDEPTVVVLPIEPWWLKAGLACLTEEVGAAGRPVAIVLLHRYNGLDAAGAIGGLLTFVSAIGPLPVILLRSDISAIGAVAYGASVGFVGWSSSTRHGSLPMRASVRGEDDERDESPGVFVPALHDYFKASKLPALTRSRRMDLLQCDDQCCGEHSLLRIAELSEVNVRAARTMAGQHNMVSTELIARRIFSAAEPRDAWWEACKAGADIRASLVGDGISLPDSRWLRQWLEAGSPSHESEVVG